MHFGADGLDLLLRFENARFHLFPLAGFVVGELLFRGLRFGRGALRLGRLGDVGRPHPGLLPLPVVARLLAAGEARHGAVELAGIEKKAFGPSFRWRADTWCAARDRKSTRLNSSHLG